MTEPTRGGKPNATPAAEPTPGAAVEVAGVTKVFNAGRSDEVVALSDVDLAVGTGEFVSLIGPSGCGKSTLLRLVADLITPTTGVVTVAGEPASAARRKQGYGIAFQQAGLFEWRTVLRNVELPLELRGMGRAARRARALEMLELVGLAEFNGHYPAQLSGGMQQRVAIARALAVSPRLLLMDEPFGALDEMTRERLQSELLGICAKTGTSTLFVTHSIAEAVFLSQRVVVMSPRPGRITAAIDVDLPSRDDAVRQSETYFEAVTSVRRALRGGGVPVPRTSEPAG
ncbi:MAG TPA: ABC transporter ATP-binding protein [Actinoplanes sp.]|nr:ABC transporter ATP-binding protein [Actinoplanes sp.]